MPDDPFSDLETKSPSSSSKSDPFSDLEAPKKDTSLLGRASRAVQRVGKQASAAAPAFAANAAVGAAQIPEQAINMAQFANRNMHPLFNPSGELMPNMSPIIDPLNKMAGAPSQPYLDITGAMNQNPSLGFGQTPAQLMKQHPIAGTLGNVAGSVPSGALLPVGALGNAATKLPAIARLGPLAGNIIKGAFAGGEYSSLAGALESAGEQVKSNDTLDPAKLAISAEQQFLPGVALGAIGGLFRPRNLKPKSSFPPAEIKRLGYTPSPPNAPKQIEMKGPIIPMGPKEKLEQRAAELFGPREMLQGEVVHNEQISTKKGKPTKTTPKISIIPSEVPSSDIVESKVENIVDSDNSWRTARQQAARPADAKETPLAKDVARNKVNADAIRAQLRGAIRQMYDLLKEKAPLRQQQVDKKFFPELTNIAKGLGGTPKTMVSYVESTLSPADKFSENYNFKATSIEGKMAEIRDLEKKYNIEHQKYENFKAKHEEELNEILPLNETIQVNVKSQEHGNRVANVRRVWRASKYQFPNPQAEAKYKSAKAEMQSQSTPYEDFDSPAFKKVIQDVANKGTNLEIEGLADKGALDWFNQFDKDDQTKIILSIGIAASLYLNSQQEAQAAPPAGLVGKVIKQLAKGGWREWMGSRPITRITQLTMTTDMLRTGFDAGSKAFFAKRMKYLADLKLALNGAREMDEAEMGATAKLNPFELRRTPLLHGWTQIEKNKAGDISDLNRRYKELVKSERERLNALQIAPGHRGAAQRYSRAVDIDAHDMGIRLDYDPLGKSPEILNKLTAEIMKSQFLGNIRVSIYHFHEALTASISKYPTEFVEALHGLATSPIYREFAEANSPHGFFQQLLEHQQGFKYRDKIDKTINGPIDRIIKKVVGETGYQTIMGQTPERAKLGLNTLVIVQHEAKAYPGGPEQYMKDWLANAKNRTPVPIQRQTQFAKVALNEAIESNIANGSLPEGPIKERTVFQRTKAFTLVVAYTRGKIQQSRFVFSLLDDALQAISQKDNKALAKALRGFLTANLLIFGAAGSAAIPPYIWFSLEQIDRAVYNTPNDVQDIKDALDDAQKNIGPGYQIRHVGLAGFAETSLPTGAFVGTWNQLQKNMHPKNKADILAGIVDATTIALISRLGPEGILNLHYMLERIYKGMTGKENFKTYEEGAAGLLAAQLANKSPKTGEQKLDFDLGQGILHAFAPVQNRAEVKAIEKGERVSAKNLPKNLKIYGKSLKKALQK